MHEIMTGQKYVLPKTGEKKKEKKGKATLQEVTEEEKEPEEKEEVKEKEDIIPQSRGKWGQHKGKAKLKRNRGKISMLVCMWRHGGHVGWQEQKHFSTLGT